MRMSCVDLVIFLAQTETMSIVCVNQISSLCEKGLRVSRAICFRNMSVTSGAGPRAVGTERGRWSE